MEEYTIFLTAALRRQGWRSVLIFTGPPDEEVHRQMVAAGALVEVIPVRKQPQFYWSLLRLLWKHRPSVVHYHFLRFFSLLPLVTRMAPVGKIFFTEHVAVPRQLSRQTLRECWIWDRVVLPLLRVHVLAISAHVQRVLGEFYAMRPNRIRLLLNGVNTARFAFRNGDAAMRLRRELGIPAGTAAVVTVAHLVPEKGVTDLLAAAPHILAERPRTVFIVVGDGPLAGALEQQAQELGISGRVRFTGLRSDVDRFLGLADVVVVPSVWQEPAGLVVLEGMAAGKPVVATRVGGIPEYLDDDSGVFVDAHSSTQLTRAVLHLLSSPEQAAAMGHAGRRRIQAHFSMQRWIGDTLTAYQIEETSASAGSLVASGQASGAMGSGRSSR